MHECHGHLGRARRLVQPITVVPLFVVTVVNSFAQGGAAHWTGTWAVSPTRGDASHLTQKTFRQIVHASIDGEMTRLQISNLYGTTPLTIEDVHIALRASGSSIVPSSDHPVKFRGASRVIIKPGTAAVSDASEFHVRPLSDVAVSFYLPAQEGPTTFHGAGLQTNYIADGDVSGHDTLANAKTTGSYYFLTNLDVINSSALGAVVTLGASITDGYSSDPDSNRRWPNDLAQRLVHAGLKVGVLNQGISGNRLLSAGSGDSAEDRFDRDVLQQPGVRWVVFSDEPINDLGSAKVPPSSGQLIAGLKRLIARAHRSQIKFYCSTLTPYEGAEYWSEAGEVAREQINAFIRGGASGCDGIIDEDDATHDPAHPTRYLPAFDIGDHLHPNTAGLQAIADAVDLSLLSAITR